MEIPPYRMILIKLHKELFISIIRRGAEPAKWCGSFRVSAIGFMSALLHCEQQDVAEQKIKTFLFLNSEMS